MTNTLTNADVINVYKIVFGRAPESEATIMNVIKNYKNIDDLRNALFQSPEFLKAQKERTKAG